MKIATLALTLVAAANADRTSSAANLRRELEGDKLDLLLDLLFPEPTEPPMEHPASIQASKSAKSSVGGKSGKSGRSVSCIIHIIYHTLLYMSCIVAFTKLSRLAFLPPLPSQPHLGLRHRQLLW